MKRELEEEERVKYRQNIEKHGHSCQVLNSSMNKLQEGHGEDMCLLLSPNNFIFHHFFFNKNVK